MAGSPTSTPLRRPAVAGAFYPETPAALRASIEACFTGPHGPGHRLASVGGGGRRSIRAGIAPHAGYVYSGPVAAHLFEKLSQERPPRTVVILGVNHRGLGGLFSLSDEDWMTPLGVVRTDTGLLRELSVPPLKVDGRAHRQEHSIEVELPFLQYIWGDAFSIVALQVTFTSLSQLKEAGMQIAQGVKGKDVLLLASTDFSHYVSPAEEQRLDGLAISSLLTLSPDRLFRTVVENDISMCGIAPTTVLLAAMEGSGASIELLKRGHSGDAEPMESVVGYASFLIREK